jgi:hypothetical protein
LVIIFFMIFILKPMPQGLAQEAKAQPTNNKTRRVNILYFAGNVSWVQSAIFWFGRDQLTLPGSNYADVRVAYTSEGLRIFVTIVDYYLWYQENASLADDLTQYDAVAVYLDTNHDLANVPKSDDYWFLLGSRWWEDMSNYMRQAHGNGSSWNIGWTPSFGWIGDSYMQWDCNPGPNYNGDCGGNSIGDFGWMADFTIPWQTLGLSGPPSEGSLWGLGVKLYDRDDNPPAGFVTPEYWPETFNENQPSTWAEIHFGNAQYQPLPAVQEGTAMIRAVSPQDNTVEDAWMGGGGWCNGGQFGSGDTNHGDDADLFVGSEIIPVHFPCYNKSFFGFSLASIPQSKVIISATLTLHHWGNADPTLAQPSWVHLFTISDPWDEMTITWNTAPLAQENISTSWIYPLPDFKGWPGNPYNWDATQAVAKAYTEGHPASMAIYESDTEQHSSKYLTGSEVGDWDAEGRPTLTVVWGSPVGTIGKTASSASVMSGEAITYSLDIVGSGQTINLTDYLPTGVSAPTSLSPGLIYTPHRLTWSGSPGLGQPVQLNYTVTAIAPSRTVLWNQAVIIQTNGMTDIAETWVYVDPVRLFLPCVH